MRRRAKTSEEEKHESPQPAGSGPGGAGRTRGQRTGAQRIGERRTGAAGTCARAAALYERPRDLPRLLPMWPEELRIDDLAAHRRLVARLRRALRAERQRGEAGHWTYDLARHAALLSAYRFELSELAARLRAAKLGRNRPPSRR